MRARRMGATVGGLLIAAALAIPTAAQAELCDAPTGICIVNPPTAANPWVGPQLVQVRLPEDAQPNYSSAGWTQPGAPEGDYPHRLGGFQLVEQGPLGGTSLYQGIFEPDLRAHGPGPNVFMPLDGAVNLTVTAAHGDSACTCIKESTATFSGLPVSSTVASFHWQIVRRGRWFQAVMAFEARAPVRVKQLFHVSAFAKNGDVDFAPLPLRERRVTGIGPVRVVQKLSVRYVKHQCEGHRRCELVAEAVMETPTSARVEEELLNSISRKVSLPKQQTQPQ
jgi:hypothetical protein